MVKINRSELQTAHTSMQSARLSCLSNLAGFENSVSEFASSEELTGATWQSAKEALSPYGVLSKALLNYQSDFGEAFTNFLSSFESEVGATENVLDTDKLVELQTKITRIQSEKHDLMVKIAGNIALEIIGGYGLMAKDFQIGQVQKKVDILEKYQAFEASHASDFSGILATGDQLETGFSELAESKHFNAQTGTYTYTDLTNSTWYTSLRDYNLNSPSQRIEVVETEVKGTYRIYVNGEYNELATNNYMFAISKDGLKALGLLGISLAGETTGAFSVYRLFTGKDPLTGEEVSRLEAGLWSMALLLSQAGLIKVMKELRAGNKLLKGTQLSAKDLKLLREAGYFEDAVKVATEELSKLNSNGKFVDDVLESNYEKYLNRKKTQGRPPKNRLEWYEASEYWSKNSSLARGNRFNQTAKDLDVYDYHEIHLSNGKRLDSYDPISKEIISRKATNLGEISEITYRKYLSEFKEKYRAGTTIRSNKYPELDGLKLEGDYFLEIPSSNADLSDIEHYKKIAKEYDVILRFLEE